MDTKTYNVNLKAKKTSWGGIALNLSKNGKILGGVNKPMDSEMALVFTDEKNGFRCFYPNWKTMESIPDEFVLSPDLKTAPSLIMPKVKSMDVSLLDTSNLEIMDLMFANCREIEELDLSNFNVKNVVTFTQMFENCYKLKSLDLTGWDTSNGMGFSDMFAYCGELEEIKGVIDITNASTYRTMFDDCNKLKSVKIKATPSQQGSFRSLSGVSPNTEVIFV